ncbi:MAG: hypothetical protein APF76_04610 [Desulfitibacter sp. BRH_c19]|nr:MAG: hypothetical protein APF76_04610 [Desulfitibacter sp. BRH_c19]
MEWDDEWRKNNLFLDTIIKSDLTKEIVNKNYKLVLWFENHNYTVTRKLKLEGKCFCEINFLMGDYNTFTDI